MRAFNIFYITEVLQYFTADLLSKIPHNTSCFSAISAIFNKCCFVCNKIEKITVGIKEITCKKNFLTQNTSSYEKIITICMPFCISSKLCFL